MTDKDEANKLKLETLKAVAGTGSTNWLQANAFSIAMLGNFYLMIVLVWMEKPVPKLSTLLVLAWAAGPLLNSLRKETLDKLMQIWEVLHKPKEEKK